MTEEEKEEFNKAIIDISMAHDLLGQAFPAIHKAGLDNEIMLILDLRRDLQELTLELSDFLEKECVDLIDDTIWVAGKYLKNASFTLAYRRFVRCASSISIIDWKYCQEKCPKRKRINKND